MRDLAVWLKDNDYKMLYFVNRRMRCPFLDYLMPKVTSLGGAVFTIGLFLLLFFLMGMKNRLVTEGILSLAVSHSIAQICKKIFTRLRPYMKDKNVIVFRNPLKDYSFPSGHTTAVFSLSTSVGLVVPWLFLCLYPVGVLVGLSRIYLGLHYPLDVAVGAFIGACLSVVIHFCWGF